MHIFYTPDIITTSELPLEESAHAIRVLRLQEGDAVTLTDGKGYFYKALITHAHAKHCEVTIIEKEIRSNPWSFHLHVAVAPTKNMDRIEWFVEKSTEIGIDEISLLLCRYSERKEIKTARLEKIAINAMKQSQKGVLPIIHEMVSFSTFVAQPFVGRKFIAHCEPGEKQLLSSTLLPKQNALILIGPEGDFSLEEIKLSEKYGFEPISLGKSRLRTETAALFACNTSQIINQ